MQWGCWPIAQCNEQFHVRVHSNFIYLNKCLDSSNRWDPNCSNTCQNRVESKYPWPCNYSEGITSHNIVLFFFFLHSHNVVRVSCNLVYSIQASTLKAFCMKVFMATIPLWHPEPCPQGPTIYARVTWDRTALLGRTYKIPLPCLPLRRV